MTWGNEPPRLGLLDVFQVQTAADPQISPDGSHIVYVRQFCDIMSDRRYANLWMINFDGSDARPLTSGNFNDSSPRWTPDGKTIVFLSDRSGTTQIHRLWIDSGQTTTITSLTAPPSNIGVSPDGQSISFVMQVVVDPIKIANTPKAPEGAKWADPAKVIDQRIYRFNGAGYLKDGYWQVFVVPAAGGAARQISSGDFQHGGPAFFADEPVWTPDGKYLLMGANRHADYLDNPRDTEVYEFNVETGAVRALTNRRGADGNPVVSPDGQYIAYTGLDDHKQGYEVTRLYVMKRDGSNPKLLSGKLDRDVRSAVWASTGRGLYFITDDHGNSSMNYITLDGDVKKLSGNLGSTRSAYGGGAAFTIANNGNFAATYTRPDVPGDVAVGTLNSPSLKTITSLNAGLFAGKQLGAVEEIRYPSSKDQREIQGWIIKPPGFDPAKKYPLILEIHGGPFANYGDRFDLEKQLMAAAGYVVLYTNPRGSTSYGGDFGNLIHHSYPGDDFYDLNSGVDAVIAKGYIDTNRLYVTGGSGGGVLTCWMIGNTRRFKAAVPVYPVINWYSFMLTSDIGGWVSQYWFPGLPWDNVEHYEKRSLLSVVKNVKTPTLVMTGEADYRTPISDSEQYYQALQILHVESVMVRVPDEPHGIQVRPSHHMTKIATIIGWFDKHP